MVKHIALFNSREISRGIRIINTALKLDPNYIRVLYDKGIILANLDKLMNQ